MGVKKVPVHLSLNKDLDEFFKSLCNKTINVDGKEILFSRNKNDIYARAIEYALENINEWFR